MAAQPITHTANRRSKRTPSFWFIRAALSRRRRAALRVGGGAENDHGQVYPGGEPHHRLDNDKILDHLVELVEKKAAEIKAREEKESVAAE
jgi:hypothetical protein